MRIPEEIAVTLLLLLLANLGSAHTGHAEVPKINVQNAHPPTIPSLHDLYQHTEISKAGIKAPDQQVISQYHEIMAEITAYTDDINSCGKDDGITASGVHVQIGHIAMDDSIPFGTKVRIEGMGEFTVTDRGGAITGNRIDVYMPSHEQAIRFGRQMKKAQIVR